jgi:hypothetical protein
MSRDAALRKGSMWLVEVYGPLHRLYSLKYRDDAYQILTIMGGNTCVLRLILESTILVDVGNLTALKECSSLSQDLY